MASIIEGYNYDIFISYLQKDNKHDGWVTDFVDNLKGELESAFKEEISVYFDINPHDGLLETHDVDDSLRSKLKCLIFIPIISRTYCDTHSFAWEHEFKAFIEQADRDQLGVKVRLPNGNVSSRVLPVRIYDLNTEDVKLCETFLGSTLRGIEFIYRSAGVNRPLRSKEERPHDNISQTLYRDQINKVANAIIDIISGIKAGEVVTETGKTELQRPWEKGKSEDSKTSAKGFLMSKSQKLLAGIILMIAIVAIVLYYPVIFRKDSLRKFRSQDGRISVAVFPFKSITDDSVLTLSGKITQIEVVNYLMNYNSEFNVRQIEDVNTLLRSNGILSNATITPSLGSKISNLLQANVYMYGTIEQFGSKLRFGIQFFDSRSGEAIHTITVEGSSDKEQIFVIIDSVKKAAKDFLQISRLRKKINPEFQRGAVTQSPDAYGFFIHGMDAFFKYEYETAIEWFYKALDCDSTFISPMYHLSVSYGHLGDLDSARKWCMKAFRRRPLVSPREQIALDFLKAYNFESLKEEATYLDQLLEFDDQSPQVYTQSGLVWENLGEPEKAIPYYEKAIAIYKTWGIRPPSSANYAALLGCYHDTKQYKKEKLLCKKAEKDFPDYWGFPSFLATLSLIENDTVASNRYIEKCFHLYPSPVKLTDGGKARIIADINLMANNRDKAEKFYRKALMLEPENASHKYVLAYFLISNERDINSGLIMLDSLLKKDPENISYLDNKGIALYKLGKYKESVEVLQKCRDINSKTDFYNQRYGNKILKDLENAEKALDKQ
jgi:tetratricopeptide (TPR) repeat protein